MPFKINGTSIPWGFISTVVIAIFWLAGLSFQVAANGEDIEKQVDTAERLAKIETTLEANKEDVREIKEEQKSQDEKLDKILEKVSGSR